ncbi:MAG: flagellar basal-body rod protein FlgF [Nitrospiraceae bacterium]|jgi:flagellar basal-body rod protein FlgG|nr:flagellar basal-body rod protein FlgF [Nitrospirota bacterium]MDA8338184.1 flagellar basal-body rod protein FlgF [Nitrospiraceae bacterium]
MYKGVYIAMTGAVLRSQELDSVANNLANAGTAGYKKTSFSSRLYPLLEGVAQKHNAVYPDARAMAYLGTYHIDTSEGNIKTTGNPLDLAIKGDGFFAVESKGKIYYTRNGSFSMDKGGYLVTGNGQRVMDTANKPIRIEGESISTANINIAPDGNIYVNGNVAGRLKLVNLNNVQHVGNSLFSGDEAGASKGEILQGSIEMSNVNPIQEMVGIITALRQYETAQKVIKNFDDLSQRAVSEIAKV